MRNNGWVLGIESTAHTFSFGLVSPDGTPRPSSSGTLRPDEGGIHPREAADHHVEISADLLNNILCKENLTRNDIGAIAYSQGPGMGPCLRTGASAARALARKEPVAELLFPTKNMVRLLVSISSVSPADKKSSVPSNLITG